ncbi:MAG: SIS domain-containing protein [Candidatus Margulisbacteria bacterium]|nr:SIS domain-containing protein [Candidatus Margulisiibacteriota bacterium]
MKITEYYNALSEFIKQIEALDKKGARLDFSFAVDKAIELIVKQGEKGKKVIFIGNGGSAAIASHMAVDYWKNGKIKATAFNESSLLTCISNDYGYKHVFEKPIEMFGEQGDVLIAISSSGNSENILNGVAAARAKGLTVITLSGFAPENHLRKTGDLNFYVPANAYSHVEIIHETICHYMLDMIIHQKQEEKV